MKKLFILFIFQQLSFSVFAQSITLDPSFLQLPTFSSNPGCTVSDRGKMIFNSTNNKLLYCNGTEWVAPTATPAPQFFSVASSVGAVPSTPSGTAPWYLCGAATPTINVVDGQAISANFVVSLVNPSGSAVTVSVSACYQQVIGGVPTGNIYPFSTQFIDASLSPNSFKTILPATGIVKVVTGTTLGTSNTIPPGSYRIFLAVKNKSTTVNLTPNDILNGSVIIY